MIATQEEKRKMSRNITPGLMVCAKASGNIGNASIKQIGTIDHLDGENYIKLKSGDGKQFWIPLGWVEKADRSIVYLNRTQDEIQSGRLSALPVSDK